MGKFCVCRPIPAGPAPQLSETSADSRKEVEEAKQRGGRWRNAWRAMDLEARLDQTGWDEAKILRTKLYVCLATMVPILAYLALLSSTWGHQGRLLPLGLALLSAGCCALLVVLFRATRLAAHLYVFTAFLAIAALTTYESSSYALTLWLISLVPLLAAFLLSLRAVIGYTLLSLIPIIFAYQSMSLAKSPLGGGPLDSEWLSLRLMALLVISALGGMLGYASGKVIRRLVAQGALIRQEVHDAASNHRAKSAFLAQMSHEIRTPVHGIMGMITHLQTLSLGERIRPSVQNMAQCAQDLSALLNSILDLAKLESGKFEVNAQELDLCAFVEDLVQGFEPRAQAASLSMRAELPPQALLARTDPARLRQAITPLIENAIKFSETGQIVVELRATHDDAAEGPGYEICVRDQGVGLSEIQQSKIFEHFEQCHDEFVKEKGGIGLGLTLVSRIVQLLGGKILVHSALGEGSEFVVRLPRAMDTSDATQLPGAEPQSQGVSTTLANLANWAPTAGVVADALAQKGEQAYRRRRIVLIIQMFIPAMVYYIVEAIMKGEMGMLFTLVAALTYTSSILIQIKRGKSLSFHSWNFVVAYAFFISAIGFFDGQLRSDTLWLISLGPVIAGFVIGIRGSIVSALISVCFVVLETLCHWYWSFEIVAYDSQEDALVYRLVYLVLFCAVAVSASLMNCRQTHALAERQVELLALKQHALQANEAKTRFLANMSHEIRTPMNGVLGLAEDLLAQPLELEQRSALATIHRCGGHLLVLLNEILDSSRVESDEIVIAKISFDASELLQDVVRLFSSRAEQKGLSLVYRNPGATWVQGDPTRLMQVLANLVGNAIKFSDSGNIELELLRGAFKPESEQQCLSFVVKDAGIGMSPEQATRIFDAYVQIDEQGDNLRGGTGLGLSISRNLVRAMGGELLVQSERGQGSVFTVELELPRVEPETTTAQGQVLDAPAGPTAQHRILVVDDNPINRKVASLQLTRIGCEVDTANNGADALDKVKSEQFDLVVMDLRMPVMDGIEATRQIRGLGEPWDRLPIVALTADGFEETRVACLEAGMNDHLAKPFRAQELKAMIARHLDSQALVG